MAWYINGLRLIHITAVVCWAGGAFMIAALILPAVKRLGPEGGRFMQTLTQRGLPLYMNVGAYAAIGSGLLLFWHASGGLQGAWLASAKGITLTLGSLAGIGAFLVGALINSPAAKRLGAIAAQVQSKGGPPTPVQAGEMQAMQGRIWQGTHIAAGLMAVALVLMVLA